MKIGYGPYKEFLDTFGNPTYISMENLFDYP